MITMPTDGDEHFAEYRHADGRPKSTYERQRERQQTRNDTKPPRPTAPTFSAEQVRADGQPFAERQAFRRQMDVALRRAQAEARSAQPASPFESRVSELETALRAAIPSERAAIERRLAAMQQAHANFLFRLESERRTKEYFANPQVVNALEFAESFARTPPHDSERVAAAEALEWLRCATDRDPVEAATEYFRRVEAINARIDARALRELGSVGDTPEIESAPEIESGAGDEA